MCKNLRNIDKRLQSKDKFYCEIRGVAYCKLNYFEFPEFAVLDEQNCKEFETFKPSNNIMKGDDIK